jgi:transcriptional regulator with XRE-family HTH domain
MAQSSRELSDPIAWQFADNLIFCRNRALMSQEELGFAANLHRTEIGMLERGVRMARIDTVIKLAGGLGVPPGDLLKGMFWTPAAVPQGKFVIRDSENDG